MSMKRRRNGKKLPWTVNYRSNHPAPWYPGLIWPGFGSVQGVNQEPVEQLTGGQVFGRLSVFLEIGSVKDSFSLALLSGEPCIDHILLSRPAYGGWGAVKFVLSGPFLESKHNSQSRSTFPLIFSFSSTLSGCFEGSARHFQGYPCISHRTFQGPSYTFRSFQSPIKTTKGSAGRIYYQLPWFFLGENPSFLSIRLKNYPFFCLFQRISYLPVLFQNGPFPPSAKFLLFCSFSFWFIRTYAAMSGLLKLR